MRPKQRVGMGLEGHLNKVMDVLVMDSEAGSKAPGRARKSAGPAG